MLVTVNKRVMGQPWMPWACHGSHASKLTFSKTLVTQKNFSVSGEMRPELVTSVFGQSLKIIHNQLFEFRPKMATRSKKRKTTKRKTIAKFFALHTNAKRQKN